MQRNVSKPASYFRCHPETQSQKPAVALWSKILESDLWTVQINTPRMRKFETLIHQSLSNVILFIFDPLDSQDSCSTTHGFSILRPWASSGRLFSLLSVKLSQFMVRYHGFSHEELTLAVECWLILALARIKEGITWVEPNCWGHACFMKIMWTCSSTNISIVHPICALPSLRSDVRTSFICSSLTCGDIRFIHLEYSPHFKFKPSNCLHVQVAKK